MTINIVNSFINIKSESKKLEGSSKDKEQVANFSETIDETIKNKTKSEKDRKIKEEENIKEKVEDNIDNKEEVDLLNIPIKIKLEEDPKKIKFKLIENLGVKDEIEENKIVKNRIEDIEMVDIREIKGLEQEKTKNLDIKFDNKDEVGEKFFSQNKIKNEKKLIEKNIKKIENKMTSEGNQIPIKDKQGNRGIEKLEITDIDLANEKESPKILKEESIKQFLEEKIDKDNIVEKTANKQKNIINTDFLVEKDKKIGLENPTISNKNIRELPRENIEIVNNSIVRLIETSKEGETSTMTVKLYPKELGNLDIVIKMVDSKYEIKILVEDRDIKNMFLDNTDRINKSIAKENISLQNFTVDINRGFNLGEDRGSHSNHRDNIYYENDRNKIEEENSKVKSQIKNRNNSKKGISILA